MVQTPRKLRTLKETEQRISESLEGTPLAQVGDFLLKLAKGAADAAGDAQSANAQEAISYVHDVLDRLPSPVGDRFDFDSLMIKGVAASWTTDSRRMPDLIVPTYGNDWRLQLLELYPATSGKPALVLQLLSIRGENVAEAIDLRDYGWLIHELAHCLIHEAEDLVSEIIRRRVDGVINDLKSACVADRGAARSVQSRRIEQVASYWAPTDDHCNWGHELLIDVLGIATAGAAYGRTFLAEASISKLNPFELVQSHPPFAIRATGMASAATRFGWHWLAGRLNEQVAKWFDNPSSEAPNNEFRAAAHSDLVESCVNASIDAIEQLQLPICTSLQIDRAGEMVANGRYPDPGLDLLFAAWCAADALAPSEYQDWTASAIKHALT